MPSRWEAEEKVLDSLIDPHGRLLLLTLLSLSNAATAEIPPPHVPTFDELARTTGISKSTITEWMKTLTEANWIIRESTEGKSRKGLRIDFGDPKAARVMRVRKSKDVDALYRSAVQKEEGGGGGGIPPRGTSRTAARYEDVPPRGTNEDPHCLIKNSPTESSNHTDPDQAAAGAAAAEDGTLGVDFGEPVIPEPRQPAKAARKTARKNAPKKTTGEETQGQRVNRVTKIYTDNVKLTDFHGVRGVVDAAFKSDDYTEAQIVDGITKLTEHRDPVTRNTLRIAIEGLPSWSAGQNGGGYTSGGSGNHNQQRRSTYVRMTDSHHPDRDYSENY